MRCDVAIASSTCLFLRLTELNVAGVFFTEAIAFILTFQTSSYEDLDSAIAFAYSQVSLKDIRNWFVTRS
ncbi:MAG: hypothetical protein AAF652_16055 [Cyanobacteria bacterium P01_C01_bin.72]